MFIVRSQSVPSLPIQLCSHNASTPVYMFIVRSQSVPSLPIQLCSHNASTPIYVHCSFPDCPESPNTTGASDKSRVEMYERGQNLLQSGDNEGALRCFLQCLKGLELQNTFVFLPQCLRSVSTTVGVKSASDCNSVKRIVVDFQVLMNI